MAEYLVNYQVHIHTPTHPRAVTVQLNEVSPEQKQQKSYRELDAYLNSIGKRHGQGLFLVDVSRTAAQLKSEIVNSLTYPDAVALRIYTMSLAATHN